MRSRTWIGAAAIAALTTVSAVSLAVAQERQQPGQEGGAAAHQMEKGAGAMKKGEGARTAQAQAQSPGEESQRHERSGQEKMGQEKMGQAMKPGEERNQEKTGQAMKPGEEHNQAQTEQTKGEQHAQENQKNEPGAMKNGENRAANQPGEEKGKAAERAGEKPENKTAAEGQTNEHRAGEAQNGGEMQNNRQGEQHAGRETHVNPQNVRAEGNAHLSNDRAARVADTLMASSNRENVHINVNDIRVGGPLPGDVTLMPLPSTIVDLVPEFRGYDYIVANDEIVIVQPSSREVVEVINTGGGVAMNEGAQAMASTHVAPCGNP